MKTEEMDDLLKKYMMGDTTLQEERALFENAGEANPVINSLGRFIKKNKLEVPENLNDKLWDSFQGKRIGRKRYRMALLSAAASLLLVIGIVIGRPKQHQLSYAEKESLLRQARGMFVNTAQNGQQNVIYEDDLIVIYTSTE